MRIYRKPLPSVTNIQPPKRMDIWYAHLRENTGTSVQEGDRPVLVISNDVANRCSDVVTVLPLTSQIKKMYMPTHCIISDLLDEDSVVLANRSLPFQSGGCGESCVPARMQKWSQISKQR